MNGRSEKHTRERNRLNDRLIGELTAGPAAPAVIAVQRKTGIQPPSWFNVGGATLAGVNAVAVTQRARR